MSLSLVKSPREMLAYVTENLSLYQAMYSTGGITRKNVHEVLSANNVETIKIGNLKARTWFNNIAARGSEIVSLCLICQIVKPKIVFEIGTMNGYTAFHFALNLHPRF